MWFADIFSHSEDQIFISFTVFSVQSPHALLFDNVYIMYCFLYYLCISSVTSKNPSPNQRPWGFIPCFLLNILVLAFKCRFSTHLDLSFVYCVRQGSVLPFVSPVWIARYPIAIDWRDNPLLHWKVLATIFEN